MAINADKIAPRTTLERKRKPQVDHEVMVKIAPPQKNADDLADGVLSRSHVANVPFQQREKSRCVPFSNRPLVARQLWALAVSFLAEQSSSPCSSSVCSERVRPPLPGGVLFSLSRYVSHAHPQPRTHTHCRWAAAHHRGAE